MNGNLARIWKEAAMTEILLQHFSEGIEQNHEKILSEIIYDPEEIRNGHLLNTSLRT
jgi:hypothetical protein